jgi:hypothetical protein
MPEEKIYKVSFKPNEKDYFQLEGSNNQVYYYYYKSWYKDRLISKTGKNLINYKISHIFSTAVTMNYLYPSKLNNIKFYLAILKYKIKGDYLYGKGNINWRWIKGDLCSENFILIDKNCNNQIMAKVSGFGLTRKKHGILNIIPGVPEDFRQTIIASACIIWKREVESNKYDDRRSWD